MAGISPDWIRDQFLDHFRDSMASEIDDSDFDFEGYLFQSGLKYVSGTLSEVKPDRDLTIRGIISGVLADSIEFRPGELDAWSGNAYDFSSLNFQHPSFTTLFSDAKNYDVVLKDIITVDYDYHDLRFSMQREMGVSVKSSLFSDDLAGEVIGEIFRLAGDAIRSSLIKLSVDIQVSGQVEPVVPRRTIPEADKIKRAPSFRNMKGAILFTTSNDRLTLDQTLDGLKKNPYSPVMRRSIDILREHNIIQRIGNKDGFVVRYLREYMEYFDAPETEDRALLLFHIGMDIETRFHYNQNGAPEDERLDNDLGQLLSSFIVANGIYVQNYRTVGEMAGHIERSRLMLQKLSNLKLAAPGKLIEHLSERRAQIYEEKAGEIIERISEKVKETNNPNAGLVALELGALRGSFREMANQILSFVYKNFKDEVKKISSDAIKSQVREIISAAMSKPGLIAASLTFVTTYQRNLRELADGLPAYFSWLRYFIDLITK